MLGCDKFYYWSLYNRNKSHIGICRNNDRTEKPRVVCTDAEVVCNNNACRAVRRADYRNGSGFHRTEPAEGCHAEREKYAELRRRTEKHKFRVGQHGAEVDHCTDADEKHQREKFVCNAAVVKNADDSAVRRNCGTRQVHNDRAEAHRQKKSGFHILFDCKINKDPADDPHNGVVPVRDGKIACDFQKTHRCSFVFCFCGCALRIAQSALYPFLYSQTSANLQLFSETVN